MAHIRRASVTVGETCFALLVQFLSKGSTLALKRERVSTVFSGLFYLPLQKG